MNNFSFIIGAAVASYFQNPKFRQSVDGIIKQGMGKGVDFLNGLGGLPPSYPTEFTEQSEPESGAVENVYSKLSE